MLFVVEVCMCFSISLLLAAPLMAYTGRKTQVEISVPGVNDPVIWAWLISTRPTLFVVKRQRFVDTCLPAKTLKKDPKEDP